MADFLAMGGYAAFIWPAWGIGAAVIALITVHTILCKRRARMRLAMLEDAAGKKATGKKAASKKASGKKAPGNG